MAKKIINAAAANREAWFIAALPLLQEHVFAPAGLTIPSDVRVSCSWPGGRSSKKAIGQCWPRHSSNAKVNELFISPLIAEPVQALDILSHELVHAIDDCKNGHKAAFKKMALAIGLTGKMTHTVASPELVANLKKVIAVIGAYPHAALNFNDRKKQTTRNIAVQCQNDDCLAKFRMSQSHIDHAGDQLICPVCHGNDLTINGEKLPVNE